MFKVLLTLILLLTNSELYSKEPAPKRVVVLSPSVLISMKDLGVINSVVCAAEPFGESLKDAKIKSVGYYHRPNLEKIVACRPDLIIATYAGTPPETYNKLKKMGYKLLFERPKDVESVKRFIIQLSSIFNVNADDITKRFDNACVKQTKVRKKKFAVFVGLDPMFCAGTRTFVSSAIECSGLENVFRGEYTRTNIESTMSKAPDLIIISVDNPSMFKDHKKIKDHFKNVMIVSPELLLKPSTRILEGIETIKKGLKD